MTRRSSAILGIALSLALVLGACGDDATPGDDAGDRTEDGRAAFTVTVTADGIEMPDEVSGGIVEVTVESDFEASEVNFSQVTAGTTEDDFKQALATALGGGPIPDFIEAQTGASGTTTLVLPEGEYIAWAAPEEPEDGEEGGEGEEGDEPSITSTTQALETPPGEGEGPPGGGPSPDDILSTTFTAAAGERGDLPEAEGGEITARDYTFDVNVTAGDGFVFRNEGPDQFHHAVLFNFGDLEASVVEENLEAFFESEEDAPPPPAFKDLDFENLEAGFSPVLSPGLASTAEATFDSGSTYVAACFISDKSGGPPHAIAHGMRVVFTVE